MQMCMFSFTAFIFAFAEDRRESFPYTIIGLAAAPVSLFLAEFRRLKITTMQSHPQKPTWSVGAGLLEPGF